jgi:hypothetical protein
MACIRIAKAATASTRSDASNTGWSIHSQKTANANAVERFLI